MSLYEEYLKKGDAPEETFGEEKKEQLDPVRRSLSLIPKFFGLGEKELLEVEISGRAVSVQRDGIFLVEKDGAGFYVSKVVTFPVIPELTTVKEIRQGFYPKVPKIPVELLLETFAMFKDICRIAGNLEAYIRILFNKETKEFLLETPVQKVTAGHVSFGESNYPSNISIVMEIHSHNSMDAFFSGTDDGNEKKQCGLYGVIGKIDKDNPTFKWRTIGNKTELQLFENTLDLFDTEFTSFPMLIHHAKKNRLLNYNKELLKNITDGSSVVHYGHKDYSSEAFSNRYRYDLEKERPSAWRTSFEKELENKEKKNEVEIKSEKTDTTPSVGDKMTMSVISFLKKRKQ